MFSLNYKKGGFISMVYLKKENDTLLKIDMENGNCELYCEQEKLPLSLRNINLKKDAKIALFDFLNTRILTVDREHSMRKY